MSKIDPLLNLISPYSFLLSVMGHFFSPNISYPQLVESTAVLLGDTEG